MYRSNGTARAGLGYNRQQHQRQQQPPQDEKRGRARNRPFDRNAPPPDRMYNQVRMMGQVSLTTGPAIPNQVVGHSYSTAMKMVAGKCEIRPTFVLGLRATDESILKPSSRVVRGFVETLRDDTVDLLDHWKKTDRSTVCNAMGVFQLVKDNYELEEGRPWTVWAYRNMSDQQPVELKTVQDSLDFLEDRLDQLAMPDPDADAADYREAACRMIMHFVVEVSPTWPKLFQVTYHSDNEEEVDEEEMQTRARVQQRQLEWKRMVELRRQKEEARTTVAKQTKQKLPGRVEEVDKARIKLSIGKKEPERPAKETGKKEPVQKVSESRREREKREAERKEAERKAKERERRKEREAREEKERKEREKERDRARQRRREKEEAERKEVERQLREDRLRRERERERKRREREIQEEQEKRDRRERERQRDKDRLRERTSEKKVLIRSHGQVTVGTSTSTTSRPFLRAFLRGHT